jgi:Ca2+-binding RTX toxin-like protein
MRNIYGTDKADTLNGNQADNDFWSYDGNDVCRGKAGDDEFSDYFGGPSGTTGSDKFIGGAGDDFFLTMNGNDKMLGGAGNDEFISYNRDSFTVSGGAGDDDLTIDVVQKKDFQLVVHDGAHRVYEHGDQTIDIRGVEHIHWTS